MSFLNLALLGGIAAFMVPLLIHLLNRSQHQSIDWGAIHLLEAALQVNSRRFQWESILLLLLRCLIPILFAVGLARPVLTSLRSSAAQGEASMVVMLDNSLSMQAVDPRQPDQSPFTRGLNQIRQLISQPASVELSIWSCGSGPVNLIGGSTFDTGLALRALARIKPGAGPSDPIDMIDAGVAQLAAMANPSKQLVIASDFQASQWNGLTVEQLQRLKELLNSGPQPIQLSLWPLASSEAPEAQQNLSVELASESREFQFEPIFANDPLRVTATIHNWGNQDKQNITVTFRADEQALASEILQLPANSKRQVQFGCSFKTTGKHTFSVQIQPSSEVVDQLDSDDVTTGVVYVREPIQVVVVDPTSGNTNQFSAGEFLQLALSPGISETSYQVRLLPRMPPVDDLHACDVLVIVGISFDDKLAGQVMDYVNRGLALMLVPADNMDYGRINRVWFEQTRFLPARYSARKTGTDQPVQFKQQIYQDNVMSLFNSEEQGDLSSVESLQWHALELDKELSPPVVATNAPPVATFPTVDQAVSSLLMLEDDTLIMAKRIFGEGAVLQLGFSPSPQWSNLATRPLFVPLMQRLVLDLVGDGAHPPQQLLTGQSLALTQQQFQRAVGGVISKTPSETTNRQWELIDPSGDRTELTFSNASPTPEASAEKLPSSRNQSILQIPILYWPGVYRLRSVDSFPANAAEGPILVAAAIPSHESDLRPLSQSQLDQLSNTLGANVVRSAEDYHSTQQLRRDGREIWRPLLVILLIFLFAEIFLARRITRVV